jgi:hypothetical protein
VYATSTKALKRWADERLTLHTPGHGTDNALFRYEGTTCANMGHPLRFEYHVRLGPGRDGYPIAAQRCVPAADDTGHTRMCSYTGMGDALLDLVAADAPLAGQPLSAIIGWQRPTSVAGCYCDDASRVHKWGLVLETIHYALARTRPEPPQETTGPA